MSGQHFFPKSQAACLPPPAHKAMHDAGCTNHASTIADQSIFKLNCDHRILRTDDGADHQLPATQIEHQPGSNRHADQPIDPRTRFGQIAHHRFVTVIAMDYANAAEHRTPL